MSKIIKLEFNSLGVLVNTETDEIRQGDKGVVVNAYFEGKNNANYTARLNLTRSDEKQISDVLMTPSTSESTLFTKKLDSLWYFAKSGETTLTVFLSDANGIIANGQVVIAVEKTDYSEDPAITPDQYAELVELIASKLNITSGIMTANTMTALGNLLDYEVGQLFYIRNDGKIYQLNSSYNLDVVIDFYLVNFTILNEVEVVEIKTANQVKKTIYLKNPENQTFYDFEVVFDVATNEKAGLMSASDKVKLSALPTASQIEQQHTNLHNEVVTEKNRAEGAESSLHNEVVAEKNRAMGIEAQKEDKANKKNVISGDSTTDYPSVKAVKDFVNDAINNVSAYYITKNATGDAFDSVAQLTSATTFYSGGQVRTPTRNDYCIVRVDENHGNATTRYTYQNSQWEFQYVVNEEPLTDAQLQAINSGITSARVNAYDEHIENENIHVEKQEKDNWNAHIVNTDKHIQSGERAKWNEVENKQIKNKTFDHIPSADELEEGQVGIIPSIEDGETIIGEGLELTTDTQGNKTLQVAKIPPKILVIPVYETQNTPYTMAQAIEYFGSFTTKWHLCKKDGSFEDITEEVNRGEYDDWKIFNHNFDTDDRELQIGVASIGLTPRERRFIYKRGEGIASQIIELYDASELEVFGSNLSFNDGDMIVCKDRSNSTYSTRVFTNSVLASGNCFRKVDLSNKLYKHVIKFGDGNFGGELLQFYAISTKKGAYESKREFFNAINAGEIVLGASLAKPMLSYNTQLHLLSICSATSLIGEPIFIVYNTAKETTEIFDNSLIVQFADTSYSEF